MLWFTPVGLLTFARLDDFRLKQFESRRNAVAFARFLQSHGTSQPIAGNKGPTKSAFLPMIG